MTPTIPEKALRAAQEATEGGFGITDDDMRRALTAALPFLQGVKVKALEWPNSRITEDGREAQDAESPVGRYIATDTGWFLLGRTGYELERGLHQSKAAAQADYEDRILSAIEPAPSPRAQALEEAARHLDDEASTSLSQSATCSDDMFDEFYDRSEYFKEAAASVRALSSQPVADGWSPIETAPKDGTVIDLWSSEFGRQPDCFWGKREHHCGEAGQYCDSDWHSEPEAWIDSALNSQTFDDITHWRHLPASPGASE